MFFNQRAYRIEVKYIKLWTRNTFTAYVKLASSCKSCIIIMMVLSMSLLLTLFHNSTHFLSTHRFFSSSLSNQGSLHYWHLTIIIANSLRLSSSLSRFYGVAWLLSGTNISRLCIVLMQFLGIWQFPKYNSFWLGYISYYKIYLKI